MKGKSIVYMRESLNEGCDQLMSVLFLILYYVSVWSMWYYKVTWLCSLSDLQQAKHMNSELIQRVRGGNVFNQVIYRLSH